MNGIEVSTELILQFVAQERSNQDEKWGEQNHSLVYGDSLRDEDYHQNCADTWKRENDYRVERALRNGVPAGEGIAWDGILCEEVHEAFAESDPVKAVQELIQAAAVAVAVIESVERQHPGTFEKATAVGGDIVCPGCEKPSTGSVVFGDIEPARFYHEDGSVCLVPIKEKEQA